MKKNEFEIINEKLDLIINQLAGKSRNFDLEAKRLVDKHVKLINSNRSCIYSGTIAMFINNYYDGKVNLTAKRVSNYLLSLPNCKYEKHGVKNQYWVEMITPEMIKKAKKKKKHKGKK